MDLENKVCLITGANSGIGKQTALELAKRGAYIVMLCRNKTKATSARREIIEQSGQSGVDIILADLAHQHDVRRSAQQFCDKFDTLDILINNAGIVPSKRLETPEGIERTFAINHLAPFLLTNLLMESLEQAQAARVINVSSEVHRLGAQVFDLDNLQLQTGFSPYKAYGLSKLCNIMFTHELAKRTNDQSITTNCLHPGVVGTQLADEAGWLLKVIYTLGKPFMRSAARGARTSIYLATSEEANNISGKYFRDEKVTAPAAMAFDDTLTAGLWEKSEQLTDLC